MAAIALALLMKLFTEPAERAKAMGVFGFVVSGGGTLGVLLGGVLTDAFAWNWIFLVNLPIGIGVFVGCLVLLPKDLRGRGARRHGRRRRRHGDGRADARGLRDRERQRVRAGARGRRSACSSSRSRCSASSC